MEPERTSGGADDPVPTTLVVDGGDLPGLVCCMLEADPSTLALWHRRHVGAAGERRLEAVRAHAALLGDAMIEVAEARSGPRDDATLDASIDLLEACAAAERLGCHRVVWPVVTGPDPEAFADAVERAALATSLASRRPAEPKVLVELPVADLALHAIADLAADLALPAQASWARAWWPCADDGSDPCGACPDCRPWRHALEDAGLDWPWAAGTTTAGSVASSRHAQAS